MKFAIIKKLFILIVLIFFPFLLSLNLSSQNSKKNPPAKNFEKTKANKQEISINSKINYLEKRISYLERKVELLEKKFKELMDAESDIKLSIDSIQLIHGATKEGLKIDIKVENITEDTIDFIFGDLQLLSYNSEILFQDKFYVDQSILPFSSLKTMIFIDNSKPNFDKFKNERHLQIKFIPKKIIRKGKK